MADLKRGDAVLVRGVVSHVGTSGKFVDVQLPSGAVEWTDASAPLPCDVVEQMAHPLRVIAETPGPIESVSRAAIESCLVRARAA
jgi:hypothetical protein